MLSYITVWLYGYMAMKGKNGKRTPLTRASLDLVAQRFRTLGEPSRLEILQMLCDGDRTVQEICELTGLGQPNVSKHLALLMDNGLVQKRKEGLYSFYRLADESVYELCNIVCSSLSSRLAEAQKALSSTNSTRSRRA